MTTSLFQQHPKDCISDFALDQWRAGELAQDAVANLEHHLAACASCRARRAALNDQAEAFLAQFPASALPVRPVGALAKPAPGQSRSWHAQRWGAAVATLALAAAVALVVGPLRLGSHSSEGTRVKGGASFGFHIKRGQQVFLGAESQAVHAGDQLRFFVSSPRPQQLAILSRDGAGTVTEYYPGNGQSRGVAAGQNVSLDSSVELDSTLGQEELWAIFCDAPFATDALRRELASRGTLHAPPNCSLDHTNVIKKAEP